MSLNDNSADIFIIVFSTKETKVDYCFSFVDNKKDHDMKTQ